MTDTQQPSRNRVSWFETFAYGLLTALYVGLASGGAVVMGIAR